MASTSRFPWPQRTTLAAGVLLLVSALLLLAVRTRAALPVTDSILIPLAGPVVSVAAAITRAAAFLAAALGIAGEIGIAGGSRVGRGALVVWGAQDLLLALLSVVPAPGVMVLGSALSILLPAAAVVAAVLVVRADVLSGAARWVLVPVAVLACASAALSFLPVPTVLAVLRALGATPTELLDPVLTALTGIAFVLWSRTEAVKHRARAVYEAW